MIIVLKEKTTLAERKLLKEKLEWMGFQVAVKEENGKEMLAIVKGVDSNTKPDLFAVFPCVEKIIPFKNKFKLAGRDAGQGRTVISIRGRKIGGGELAVIAGPCSIESKEQIEKTAKEVARSGATILRGGAFKPRTSPYEFQGLGEEGLQYLQAAGEKYGLLTISEVLDADHIELMAKYFDILQVGARNMQNFSLLKKLGKAGKPVLLKRGFSCTYQDLLMAAEYILGEGNPNVILCERGIRTFETYSRNTLDIAAVPILHELTHLPVIVDPSHGTGIRKMVAPMARAAVAAGADGIMIEVHPEPDKSVSDAAQTISCEAFDDLMKQVRIIADAVGVKITSFEEVG